MTEFVIKLRDPLQAGALLMQLKRLVTAEKFDLSVEQNGQAIALEQALDDDTRFEAEVNQIIADKLAGKLEPLTPEEEEAEERELAAYGEQKAQALGVLSDDEIVRIVNEYRREQREKAVA